MCDFATTTKFWHLVSHSGFRIIVCPTGELYICSNSRSSMDCCLSRNCRVVVVRDVNAVQVSHTGVRSPATESNASTFHRFTPRSFFDQSNSPFGYPFRSRSVRGMDLSWFKLKSSQQLVNSREISVLSPPGRFERSRNCCKLFFVSSAVLFLVESNTSKKHAPPRHIDVATTIHCLRSKLCAPL